MDIGQQTMDLTRRSNFSPTPDTAGSIVCDNCSPADIQHINEATFSGIASEIVKKRLRDGTAPDAQMPNAQLARDSFASGSTPTPAHRIGHRLGELHRISMVEASMDKATQTRRS
jgi:hypothetical protein